MKKVYTQESLMEILKEHRENITSITKWEKYRKTHPELPHSQTIMSRFGSWNKFKELLELEPNKQSRPQKYTDEDLINMLETHKEQYVSAGEWDEYAEENSLPKHYLFLERLGPDVLAEIVGYVSKWTPKNIETAILEEFPNSPPKQNEWHDLTKETRALPSYMTIIRHYGSWNKMKEDLYED